MYGKAVLFMETKEWVGREEQGGHTEGISYYSVFASVWKQIDSESDCIWSELG